MRYEERKSRILKLNKQCFALTNGVDTLEKRIADLEREASRLVVRAQTAIAQREADNIGQQGLPTSTLDAIDRLVDHHLRVTQP